MSDSEVQNQENLKELTSAIMNAMGLKHPDGERVQSASIFLSKLFKKYSTPTSTSLTDFRLNRLNGFFLKLAKRPPTDVEAVLIVEQITISFIRNEETMKRDSGNFQRITCMWISKIVQILIASRFYEPSINILKSILGQGSQEIISSDTFDEKIKNCEYFRDMEIHKEEELEANTQTDKFPYLSTFHFRDQILASLSINKVFAELFASHENKREVMNLFIHCCSVMDFLDLSEDFISIFVKGIKHSTDTVSTILSCLDSKIFGMVDFDEIIKALIRECGISNQKILYRVNAKGLSCEKRYHELLLSEANANMINDLAQTFIVEKKINNYYIIFLMNKTNQKLSDQFSELLFSEESLTKRQAIIIGLWVSQNQDGEGFRKITNKFLKQEDKLALSQKINILKIIHFCLMKVPKSHFLTQVIKTTAASDLDDQSNFQFLDFDSKYEMVTLEKNEDKDLLGKALNHKFGNSDSVHRLRVDLHSACGSSLPFMKDLNQANKIFEQSLEEVIQMLTTNQIPENLVEVVLMAVNNKLNEKFILKFDVNQKYVDWAVSLRKKILKKLINEIEGELKRCDGLVLLNFIVELMEYNLFSSEQLEVQEEFNILTGDRMIKRLEKTNFSEYFISFSNEKVEKYEHLLRPKSMIIELVTFVRFLTLNTKYQTKKEVKNIVADDLQPLKGLTVLHFMCECPQGKLKNKENLKTIIRVLLGEMKPQFDFFDLMEAKSTAHSIDYFPLSKHFPLLLQLLYPDTLKFLAKLLTSKVQVDDKKKKGRKSRNESQADKSQKDALISVLVKKLRCLFGDPALLDSYQSLMTVINEIAKPCDPIELSSEISRWMGEIKMFHRTLFSEWKEKVNNLIKLYEFVCPLVFKTISHAEIERHFLMLTDLLNTLYERFKKEENFIETEAQILKGLYILYRLDCIKCSSESTMQEEEAIVIPYDKINDSLDDKHLDFLTDPHNYYCFDCSKTICYNCAKIHRLHDIIYSGSGNERSCHKTDDEKEEKNGKKKAKKRDREEEEERLFINRYRERERDRDRERERYIFDHDIPRKALEKYLLAARNAEEEEEEEFIQRRFDYENPFSSEGRSLYESFRDRDRGNIDRLERLERFEQLNSNIILSKNVSKQLIEGDKEENLSEIQIKSCSEKIFLIKGNNVEECGCGKPIFSIDEPSIKPRKSKLNLSPLYNLFLRELKTNSFVEATNSPEETEDSNFNAHVEVEKIDLFKNDLFKNPASSKPPGGYHNFGFELGNPSNSNMNRKNVLCFGEKVVLISSNLSGQLLCFNLDKFKQNFIVKEGDKRNKDDLGSLDGKFIQKAKMSVNPVMQISFAPGVKGIVAVVGSNRISFEFFHHEGKSQRFTSTETGSIPIQRFEWIRGVRTVFSYLTKEINIMKLGKNDMEKKMRFAVGRPIIDYGTVIHGYKMIYLTILDQSGKIYRGKIEFNSNQSSDFSSKVVNFDYQGQKMTSICCYASFVICACKNGSICILNFNEENSLIEEPFITPIIEPLKKHNVCTEYSKTKEFERISEMRVITKSESQLFIACLLHKNSPDNSGINNRECGNFAILGINMRSKRTNLTVFNDQALTSSFDFIALSDKEYLISCMQDDGNVWAYRFTSIKNPPAESEYKILLSPNKIGEFAKDIQYMKLLPQITFYDPIRILSFKLHPKINDKFKRVEAREKHTLIFEVDESKKFQHFVTGIEMGVVYPGNKTEPIPLKFSFLGRSFEYRITRSRQIQIPLTVKEVMEVFFEVQPIEIKFEEINELVVKDETVHGIGWDEKSPFSEALYSFCRLVSIYMRENRELPEQFFLNENKTCIGEFRVEEIEKMISRKNYSKIESSLLMKLEFLRESIPGNPINDQDLSQILERIRANILPACFSKLELKTSVEKLCRKFSSLCENKLAREICHPLNYHTQFDIYTSFKLYEVFRSEQTILSFENLLNFMNSTLNNRTINAYLIFSIGPNITRDLTQFFRRILIEYKNYFKTHEYGLEKEEKKRLFFLCRKLLRLLCENYQLNKNKKANNPEELLLRTLEGVFCINKKEFYRDVDLNPFIYLEFNFSEKKIVENIPINLLALEEVVLAKFSSKMNPAENVRESPCQEQRDPDQPQIYRQLTEARDDEVSEGSFIHSSLEEHKMAEEENREMEDEEYYLRKEEGNFQQILEEEELEEDEENLLLERNESSYQQFIIQNEENLNKIYDYLRNLSSHNSYKLEFEYFGICENLLKQTFSATGFLTLDNSVFYVTLVYNLLTIIEKKLRGLCSGKEFNRKIYQTQYVQGSIIPLIEAIDRSLVKPEFSILYLGINHFVEALPSSRKEFNEHTKLLECIWMYYEEKIRKRQVTKLIQCLSNSQWHPQKYKKESKLSLVIRLEYFDLENVIYQLKYIGNLLFYFNHRDQSLINSIEAIDSIKKNVLKVVVKYNLRTYKNIMHAKQWQSDLEATKIDVAFEKIENQPVVGMQIIKESISKSLNVFIESLKSKPERIEKIEWLLGENLVPNEELLGILNSYYEACEEERS